MWVRVMSSVCSYFTKESAGHPGGIVQQTTGLELSGRIRLELETSRVFSTLIVAKVNKTNFPF